MKATHACLIGLLVCMTVQAAESDAPAQTRFGMPLVLHETFDEGSARWETTAPEVWAVQEDGDRTVFALLRNSDYEPEVRSPRNIAWTKDLSAGSFAMEVVLKYTGRVYNHADLCLFFGKQSPTQFYYVHVGAEADETAHSIFLVNDEPRTAIAEERTAGVDWFDGEYHTVLVKRDVDSGVIEVYFDGSETPIMRATDTTFLSGPIGIGSFDDSGNFDEIRVWGEVEE